MSPAPEPDSPSPRLGFIDAGRLGSSLAGALHRAGYPVTAVSCRDAAKARALAARLGEGAVGAADPQDVVDGADVVFATSVDDRIGPVVDALKFRPGQAVIHCSGAMPVSVLDSARVAGAETGGLHPLQTFPDEYGSDRFAGVTFGIEADRPALLRWLRRLAADLGGTCVTLDAASRPLYHASAVMVGPLTAAMAGLAAGLWSAFGVERDTAVRALSPLLAATGRHVGELGIPAALTGPYVRGDVGPVRAHLEALSEFQPETMDAYASVALAQLPIAAERGNIPVDRARELRALLERALRTSRGPATD